MGKTGIYMIRNTVNNKSYIGQSQNIELRIKTHVWMLSNNRHYNVHMQSAWNKYGEGSFSISILEECEACRLDELEMFYINKFDSYKNGYNRTEGGGGTRGFRASESSKQKMRDNHYNCSGKKNPRARSVVLLNTGEVFDCITEAASAYNVAKADVSSNAKGKLWSAGSLDGVRLVWAYEDDYSSLSQSDISDLLYIGQNSKRSGFSYRAKSVICLTTGDVFASIADAATNYNVSHSCIRDACIGRQKFSARDASTGEKLRWMLHGDYLDLINNNELTQ